MPSTLQKIFFGLTSSLLSIGIVAAQANVCSGLVSTALDAVSQNCSGLGRNEVCYGYDQVQASFLDEVADDFFSQVSDVIPLDDLSSIHTLAMDSESGQWGVAVMNLQANLPNTLPGQNITFVLMGDVEVENAVAPEDAFVPSDGTEISLAVDSANLRSGAGLNFNVVGGLRRGESVIADGISENGEWLRVVKNNRPAWVNRSLVAENSEIESLPILSNELRSPMQSFYLRTGIGQPQCVEAPSDMLLVQGPENIEVQLSVNGANVSLGSTGAFSIIDKDGQLFLQLVVFDGIFEIDGVVVRAGQRTEMCLGNEDSRGLDGESNDLVVTCAPSDPEYLEGFGETWCLIENVPSSILNYSIEILCPGETPAPVTNDLVGDTGATESELESVNCNGFALISPLLPVDSGLNTFQWTPAGGDNIQYQLVFYNYEGKEVESFFTSDTSKTVNLGSDTSTGGSFYWEVRVYQNGNYACVSFRSPNLTRVLASGGSLQASRVCTSGISARVTWSGADERVSIRYTGSTGTDNTIGQTGESGSVNISNGLGYNFINSITVSSGAGFVSLGGCP
jgi:uncharacterized protein YgiM (DUF1202 family)